MQFLTIQDEFQESLAKMRNEIIDLHVSLEEKIKEIEKKNFIITELQLQNDKLDSEITDKGKVSRNSVFHCGWLTNVACVNCVTFQAIKILNQRLFDVKKTLQEEIRNKANGSCDAMQSTAPAILIPCNDNNKSNFKSNSSGSVEMDEVKFSYLKHVVLKFLTSREIEAKHLIRAISTLLYLTETEEKLLYDTLEYRRGGWFIRN